MVLKSAREEGWDAGSFYQRDWSRLQPEADMMSALVEYLERQSDAIEVYAWTSHLDLVLTDRAEVLTWRVRIGARHPEAMARHVENIGPSLEDKDRAKLYDLAPAFWEVRYPLPEPWQFATGYANSLEEADVLIRHAWHHVGTSTERSSNRE
ncbi:MAG: hypothetical protein AAGN64_03625 [Bacteroidota bacterium]